MTTRGFTLIELSIVLVIIGLIVGGVLVGRDLISAAEVRAQITQIEKFNSATNTFHDKYGYLPGDIPAAPAAQFGLTPRWIWPGTGDGNGIVEGYISNGGITTCGYKQVGEVLLFWNDLTYANGKNLNLIEGSFSSANATVPPVVSGTGISLYLPFAKIGSNNYVYVYSGAPGDACSGTVTRGSDNNYFGISAVSSMNTSIMVSTANISVMEAYKMDLKVDDGLPQSGRVLAQYIQNNGISWAGTTGTGATNGNITSCYDNGSNAGVTQQYSITQNNGTGANCALSFQFQ